MNINEILDQVEAGLEGVTPGPWTFRAKNQVGFVTGPSTNKSIPDDDVIATADYSDRPLSDDRINMQHIARCNPANMHAIIAHIRELEERADNAEKAFVAVIKTMSDEARKRGKAEGRLAASEIAGVVDGWKARAEAAEAEVERLRKALADLRKTAALLQQNALGCATNHYGQDFQLHVMPEWLIDTSASIERARIALTTKEATDE